jgi:hypothetical protein
MRYTKPMFFYHVTREKWPKRIILRPKSNEQLNDCARAPNEPKIARICVTPSLDHCLSAIELYEEEQNVYRTLRRVRARYPYRVQDVTITKERWLDKPTVFIRVATLNTDLVAAINSDVDFLLVLGDRTYLSRQKRRLEIIRKRLTQAGINPLSGMSNGTTSYTG